MALESGALAAILNAAGSLGGGRSGKTSTTTSQQQSTNVASPVAQSLNLGFNPILSMMTGGGFSPEFGGNLSGGQSQTPSSYANPSASQSLTEGAGSVLPRYSPTGYGVGPGYGLYQTPFQNAPRSLLGNDTFLLFVIAGAVFWFASQEGS
jgi:hypothetical protein